MFWLIAMWDAHSLVITSAPILFESIVSSFGLFYNVA